MLAPNGNPTNLTERQWAQVRTEAFKEWFGDWENDPEHASKVVDENGEPKVMYHGTDLDVVNNGEPFWTFYDNSHFGTKGQADDVLRIYPDDANKKSEEVVITDVGGEEEVVEDEIFVFVEKYPEYPGGEEALYEYLGKNIQYPEMARDNGITGTVVIKFVVEKDGSITKASILREIGGGCGKEALRIVNSMPKWKPGMQSGKPVRTEFTLPVQFQLQ